MTYLTTLFLATSARRGMLKKRAHRLEPRLVPPASFDMLLFRPTKPHWACPSGSPASALPR
jgi:hypothetical protein